MALLIEFYLFIPLSLMQFLSSITVEGFALEWFHETVIEVPEEEIIAEVSEEEIKMVTTTELTATKKNKTKKPKEEGEGFREGESLSGYLLNHRLFCYQTWCGDATSWARQSVMWGKKLFAVVRVKVTAKGKSVDVCLDDIF